MGELVPPELDFLINRLSQINSAEPQLVIEHARKIYTAYSLWRRRPDKLGFIIKGEIKRRAEPVAASRGLKDDLQRLLKAARGGSTKEWETAWLGVSGQARLLVSPMRKPGSEKGEPPPIEGSNERAVIGGRSGTVLFRRSPLDTRKMKLVRAGRFSSVIPTAKSSIPRVESALASDQFSSKREADKLTCVFVVRVRDAYFTLTGRKGITYRPLNDNSTLNPKGGFKDAALIKLAKDIDGQFGTKVAGHVTFGGFCKWNASAAASRTFLPSCRNPMGPPKAIGPWMEMGPLAGAGSVRRPFEKADLPPYLGNRRVSILRHAVAVFLLTGSRSK